MKVQTRILLLLLLVMAIFVGGLGLIESRQRAKFSQIARERADERRQSFDDLLRREGEPLAMLAKDYTYWDAMVQAIATNDLPWIKENINDSTWESSDANAIWIYRPDRTRFYSTDRLYAGEALREIPLPPEAFDALTHSRLMHFFVRIPEGVMEMRAATVHPSSDSYRQTPPRGYFFAGLLWSSEVIHNLARDSDNAIRLLPANSAGATDVEDPENGFIAFSRPLLGWDNKPVARLLVTNDSAIIKELNRSSEELILWLVICAVALLLLLGVSLVLWVSRPLRLISQTLKTERLEPLEKVRGENSEFGGVAKLIREFFDQRANLIAEINERKSTQEALRESEQQLRQAQKMEAVGRLAGGVAHDFNNLLTAILGYAELLGTRQDLTATSRQDVEMIQKAGRQAAAVTHQLLAFSRKQILQPRVIDLNGLIKDFENILHRVIGEHIELRTQLEASPARVKADPNQLEQVLLNLGVNARDAMPRGGKLVIRTANVRLDLAAARAQAADISAGSYVLLEVSDEGHGMTEEIKTRIFEPFFTTKEPGKGTGLGLSTVYGVVKQSGGSVTVESSPGTGSVFRIHLPLESGAVEELRPKTAAPVEAGRKLGDTVLVVEDEEIVRELVCEVLAAQGYHVLCAGNGNEALQIVANHYGEIRLMITDVVMPEMGGLELARRIIAERPEVKVLYVSGYSESDINEHGVLATDLEFLDKPFTPQGLTRKVREMLQPSPAARAGVAPAVSQADGVGPGGGRDGA